MDVVATLERQARRRGVPLELRPGASEAALDAAERRLGLALPAPVRAFFAACDGLLIAGPRVQVLPVEAWERPADGRLVVARLYGAHDLAFDVRHLNDAGQWALVFAADGHALTQTWGSFLANKLWGLADAGPEEGAAWLAGLIALRAPGPAVAPRVWLFSPTGGLPSGVWSSREAAEVWIGERALSGTLAEYPLDVGAYEHAVRNGLFTPKSATQATPAFFASFGAHLDHSHYVDGRDASASEPTTPGS